MSRQKNERVQKGSLRTSTSTGGVFVKRLLNVLHFRSLSGVVLISGAVLLCSSFALSQTTLTNDAVMKMATAGLGEDVIISMINTQPGNYSVTPDNLIALKKAGVSDKIIAAMVNKGT